ncbi:MAG: 16S rRNA (cytosine(1402)-N(4))-methyltransferase RsmH [Candidatus Helarchaeota archaeon]|nr:16S rRNA (cytosine(1402)-N(4))-methyltransferase RsmH [Candidatus Helarchaeota archaeon]
MCDFKNYFFHNPVLVDKVGELLIINKSGIYFDGTIGGGGHSQEILKNLKDKGKLIGVDIDSEAVEFAKNNLRPFKNKTIIKKGNYANILEILKEEEIKKIDGIILDLGISSYQIDNPERGFSFIADSPLDMRMDSGLKKNASDIINNYPKTELIKIFKKYGEERYSRIISDYIVKKRGKKLIKTSFQLRNLIESIIPGKNKIKSVSRIFQALRIEVNKELENLEIFLKNFAEALKSGGRIIIISYHSLEDRLVKKYFRQFEKGCICPPDIPTCICGKEKILKIINKKPIQPSKDEIKLNPRARSAKLRAAEKI